MLRLMLTPRTPAITPDMHQPSAFPTALSELRSLLPLITEPFFGGNDVSIVTH